MVDNKLCELQKVLRRSCDLKFVTTGDACGNQAYRRSVTLMMLKAFYNICGENNIDKLTVQFSLSKGYPILQWYIII